jgi:type I restriction enzyme R subunit
MIVEQLTARSIMEPSALYEPPFLLLNDGGPDEFFAGKETTMGALFQTLASLEPQIDVVD